MSILLKLSCNRTNRRCFSPKKMIKCFAYAWPANSHCFTPCAPKRKLRWLSTTVSNAMNCRVTLVTWRAKNRSTLLCILRRIVTRVCSIAVFAVRRRLAAKRWSILL